MCGIVGYIGSGRCRDFIIEGLLRLEYRGYDSAGFVCVDQQNKHLSFVKEVGPVERLKESLDRLNYDGCVGLGHTRWASHGPADKTNAHPQFDCQKTLAVVHNGIIESYAPLRKRLLEEGHKFDSATDTEVAAHLLGEAIVFHQSLKAALVAVISQLKGAYALAFLVEKEPDRLIVVRHKSPLAVGIGDGEMFVGSDPVVFADRTNKVLFMPDDTFAFISKDRIELYDFNGNAVVPQVQEIPNLSQMASKQGFEHYMLKEIYEQKRAIESTMQFLRRLSGQPAERANEDTIVPAYTASQDEVEGIWGHAGLTSTQIKELAHLNIVAAGTSWHAARIGQFFFEMVANIPTSVHLASEYRYMKFFENNNGLVLTISQSGETADTLEAMRLAKKHGMQTLCVSNVASSTMVREADGFFLMQAGPERSVASTKAFSAQLASLYWLAHRMAVERGVETAADLRKAEEQLHIAAEVLESTIENNKWDIINHDAPTYAAYDRFIFLGRHISYPFAMEAALKLKEISYIFAQCYPAGELKHGPIALIDERTPVVIFSLLDEVVYPKLVSNAQEVKARHGHLIVFAFEGQDELLKLADRCFIIPRVDPLLAPLAMTGVMQFWVYQITKYLGRPIDMPRNLAKSVTIE